MVSKEYCFKIHVMFVNMGKEMRNGDHICYINTKTSPPFSIKHNIPKPFLSILFQANMLPQILAIPELIFVIFILILSATFFHSKWHHKNGRKNPPGPKPLPIIGNLHMIGKLPHRSLQSLSQKYGPIMSLKLGQVQTIVVSSPETAELFLKTHDSVFASRPKNFVSDYVTYGSKGLTFTEYGDNWRNMRKLCTMQLLHASKVEMFAPLRKEELGFLVNSLRKSSTLHEVVDVHKVVVDLIENIGHKMIMGRSKDDRFNINGIIHEAMNLIEVFNLADFVPWLAPFDLQVCYYI
jgi:hypothetical protein